MKISYFIALGAVLTISCAKAGSPAPVMQDSDLKVLRDAILKGQYQTALQLCDMIEKKIPTPRQIDEVLFLQGYVLAVDGEDFKGAEIPLKQLCELYPGYPFWRFGKKLLADCDYWQGRYHPAVSEYQNLQEAIQDGPLKNEASFQMGNSLLMDHRSGEALVVYRSLADKKISSRYWALPQLMIANVYLKIGDRDLAVSELQRLTEVDADNVYREFVENTLKQLRTTD